MVILLAVINAGVIVICQAAVVPHEDIVLHETTPVSISHLKGGEPQLAMLVNRRIVVILARIPNVEGLIVFIPLNDVATVLQGFAALPIPLVCTKRYGDVAASILLGAIIFLKAGEPQHKGLDVVRARGGIGVDAKLQPRLHHGSLKELRLDNAGERFRIAPLVVLLVAIRVTATGVAGAKIAAALGVIIVAPGSRAVVKGGTHACFPMQFQNGAASIGAAHTLIPLMVRRETLIFAMRTFVR